MHPRMKKKLVLCIRENILIFVRFGILKSKYYKFQFVKISVIDTHRVDNLDRILD